MQHIICRLVVSSPLVEVSSSSVVVLRSCTVHQAVVWKQVAGFAGKVLFTVQSHCWVAVVYVVGPLLVTCRMSSSI